MQAAVSTLKNELSKYLRHVKRGETVIVLDRDRPIAELRPLTTPPSGDLICDLVAKGIVRKGQKTRMLKRWIAPKGKPAHAVAALLDERRDGR